MEWTGRRVLASLSVLLVSFLFLYRDVIAKLIHDWSIDENYSHGFLVIPVALYLAWERRGLFFAARTHPSNFGLIVAIAGLGMLLAGVLGAEVFTTEVSILVTIAGTVLFIFGWSHLRVMLFPIAFMLLMIPLPAIIFNQITFPLQILASRFGEAALVVSGIPVLREGNVIHLANTTLAVAEACSGIRSLISLLTLGIIYGYFMDPRTWVRCVIAIATVPVAIITNGLRVAGTGVGAHYFGPAVADGFFHEFSGWLIFISAFVILVALYRALLWVSPKNGPVHPSPKEEAVLVSVGESRRNVISNFAIDRVLPCRLGVHREGVQVGTRVYAATAGRTAPASRAVARSRCTHGRSGAVGSGSRRLCQPRICGQGHGYRTVCRLLSKPETGEYHPFANELSPGGRLEPGQPFVPQRAHESG